MGVASWKGVIYLLYLAPGYQTNNYHIISVIVRVELMPKLTLHFFFFFALLSIDFHLAIQYVLSKSVLISTLDCHICKFCNKYNRNCLLLRNYVIEVSS